VKLDLEHRWWREYASLLQRLGLGDDLPDCLPDAVELNNLLGQQILQKAGRSIRFVSSDQLPNVNYEEHIFRTGEVSTRVNNWHDLFNALAWARFPHIKTAMNASHMAEIQRGNTAGRGPVRDALTLFDECGAIVVGHQREPLRALAERNWQQLFCDHRSAWLRNLQVFVLGHALLEKFLNPYKAISAQVLIFQVEAGFLQQDDDLQAEQIDRQLAAQIQAGCRLRCSAELSPLPLMGIPGWWPLGMQDEGFYRDTRVFRPPPEGFERVDIHSLGVPV
jgi:hypothetical protein